MAAVTSIMRAQQILLAELDALLRPYELTFARYEALVLLTFSRRGALPLGVIGERLMVAEFGFGGYEPGQLKEIFYLLRGLRLTNGDFIPEIPEFPDNPEEIRD